MKNFILAMLKRLNQKRLEAQMMEFLDDPKYCNGKKKDSREWLLELKYCTDAKDIRGIKYADLEKFYDHVRKKESSEFFRLEAAKIVRKFYRKGIAEGWVKHFPTEDELKPTNKNGRIEFMNKITKGWRRGPMPNAEMVKRVRYLKDTCGKHFRDIVAILEKETGKKQYLSSVSRWYHTEKIPKPVRKLTKTA
jgi:dGTP triphosphohydrolase